jgi:hypothetical protein
MLNIFRKIATAVGAATLVISAGCGRVTPATTAGTPGTTSILIVNEGLDPADVYAAPLGSSGVLVGSILPQRSQTMEIPSVVTRQSSTITVTAVVTNKQTSATTGPINLPSGTVTRLTLSSDGRSLHKVP